MFLALDAGGTSTRAALVDPSGQCLGYGRAGGGNPTSAGIENAVAAAGQAAEQALTDTGSAVEGSIRAVMVMAGEKTVAFREQIAARLAALGIGLVRLEPDLLGIFHSGTHRTDGYAMVAGTGTAAVRVVGSRLDRVAGGRGWLIGDAGGGYWIGHQVVRAVVAALDGHGPATALTERLLANLPITESPDSVAGRMQVLRQLVSTLYAWRPVQLSRFAPLAFEVPEDPVARGILVDASSALTDLLAAVRDPGLTGPIVVGGSVLIHGLLAAPAGVGFVVPEEMGEVVPVPDGVVGAAVLALRGAGIEVDEGVFGTVRAGIASRSF